MKINVGSKNQVKINAVKEIILDYPHLKDASVYSIEADSGIDEQPKTMSETIRGAQNRAKNAFQNCDYSFGIESGLIEVPEAKTGYMEITICAIFDGEKFHLGFSSAWEVPKKIVEYVTNEHLDLNDAAFKAGFTKDPKIGASQGLISILTKGRLDRKAYTKEAIRTALINLEKL